MYLKMKNPSLESGIQAQARNADRKGVHRHVQSCEINSRHKVYMNGQFKIEQKPSVHGSEPWFVSAGGSVTRHSLKHHTCACACACGN